MCILTVCQRLAMQAKFEASQERDEVVHSEKKMDVEDPKSIRQHDWNYNSSKYELGQMDPEIK